MSKTKRKKSKSDSSTHFDKKADISERFRNGLKEKHDLEIEDLQDGKWVYAGGNTEQHLSYFMMVYGDEYDYGAREDYCLCGLRISINSCYIYNKEDDDWIIMGNCCIHRFLPKGSAGRTCGKCGNSHRNRKNNICHSCRDDLKYSNSPYCCEKNCRNVAKKFNGVRKERCYNCFIKLRNTWKRRY